VAVRPLQSRVSKFRLSSPPKLDLGGPDHLHIRNADYLLVRCANPIPHSVNVLGLRSFDESSHQFPNLHFMKYHFLLELLLHECNSNITNNSIRSPSNNYKVHAKKGCE